MRIIAAMGVPVMCICLSCGSLEQSSQVSGYDWVLNTACYNYDTVVRLLREKGLGETASIINKRTAQLNFRTDFLRQQIDYVYVLDGGGTVIASNDSMAVAGRLFEPFHCDTGNGRCEVRGWPEYLEMCGASKYAVRNIALYRGNTTTYGICHEWTKKLPPGDGKSKNLYCVISIQESMQKGPPAVFRVSGTR